MHLRPILRPSPLALVALPVGTKPVPVLVATALAPDANAAPVPATTPPEGAFTNDGDPRVLDPALDLEAASALESYLAFRLSTDP